MSVSKALALAQTLGITLYDNAGDLTLVPTATILTQDIPQQAYTGWGTGWVVTVTTARSSKGVQSQTFNVPNIYAPGPRADSDSPSADASFPTADTGQNP
jgi:hypothetical protein